MARIYLSPLIVDIRNKQSDTVFSKWKGINYIRSRVIPANPKSAAQVAIREALARLVGLWQDAGSVMKINWNYMMTGRDKSGFNHFIGKNTVAEKDGTEITVTLDTGFDELTTWTASTGAAGGKISIAFAPSPVPAGKKITVYLREPQTNEWEIELTIASAETTPKVITVANPSTLYECFGFMSTNAPADGSEVGADSFDTATSSA